MSLSPLPEPFIYRGFKGVMLKGYMFCKNFPHGVHNKMQLLRNTANTALY